MASAIDGLVAGAADRSATGRASGRPSRPAPPVEDPGDRGTAERVQHDVAAVEVVVTQHGPAAGRRRHGEPPLGPPKTLESGHQDVGVSGSSPGESIGAGDVQDFRMDGRTAPVRRRLACATAPRAVAATGSLPGASGTTRSISASTAASRSSSSSEPTGPSCRRRLSARGYGYQPGMRIGYFLSSEEYTPTELVRQAKLAEDAGFDALWISDHFHPWNDDQGESGFVWSVIGAVVPGLPRCRSRRRSPARPCGSIRRSSPRPRPRRRC